MPQSGRQKVVLTDQKAIDSIEVYKKTLQSTSIYRYAESYCRVSVLYIMWTVHSHLPLSVPLDRRSVPFRVFLPLRSLVSARLALFPGKSIKMVNRVL